MKYRSTRGTNEETFKKVLFAGLAEDGGLYVPMNWPQIDVNKIDKNISYKDLTKLILYPFVKDFISIIELENIINISYSKQFSSENLVSFKELSDNEILVELFNGPTLAFKDFAMQLLIPLFDHFLEKEKKKINLIVATSGDTGSAAINAVKQSKNISIFCLYPSKRISDFQRRQMSTVTESNIFLCEIDGTFDDCQKIVKDILKDTQYSSENNISAVNSINWARILIQCVYYYYTYINYFDATRPTVNFSVPTGNFGDIYAGYVAYKMGLPINKLIVATNENDILHRFINTGIYQTESVKKTTSPSMDIQIASNFERLLFDIMSQSNEKTASAMNLFEEKGKLTVEQQDLNIISNIFASESTHQEEVNKIISNVHEIHSYLVDPHTATGINASRKTNDSDRMNFTLSTAHPVKFSETVEMAVEKNLDLLSNYKDLFSKDEKIYSIQNNTDEVKKFILENKN